MLIKELIEYFITSQRLRGNSPKTIENYKSFLGQFTAFLLGNGIVTAEQLTIQAVNAYQLRLQTKPLDRDASRKLSGRTVQTIMRHVKVFMRFCYREEYITKDIAAKMITPKADKPLIKILDDKEITALLGYFSRRSYIGVRNYCICLLMLDCGLRLSEVCGLTVDGVNLEKGYLTVTGKGRKTRVVPIGLKCRQALTRYYYKFRVKVAPLSSLVSEFSPPPLGLEDNYFFLSRFGTPLTKDALGLMFRKLKRRVGIPRLHAHLLRHTFATNYLLSNSGDVFQLSQLLGHEDIKTTQIYLHAANYYVAIKRGNSRTYIDRLTRPKG